MQNSSVHMRALKRVRLRFIATLLPLPGPFGVK